MPIGFEGSQKNGAEKNLLSTNAILDPNKTWMTLKTSFEFIISFSIFMAWNSKQSIWTQYNCKFQNCFYDKAKIYDIK